MSLTLGSFYESDSVGASETLNLVPWPPNTGTQAKIVGAVYGSPNTATIAADGLSLTVPKIQAGVVPLVVTVVSPQPNDRAYLVQGANIFAQLALSNHWASATIPIYGK